MKKTTLDKKVIFGLRCFFAVMTVVGALYFLAGIFLLPKERVNEPNRVEEFCAEWVRVLPDGNEVPIEVPGKCEAQPNDEVVIKTTLPTNLQSRTYLSIQSLRQDMKIYVDGVLRQEYSTADTRLFGSTSSMAYIFLELEPEDGGKTLAISTISDSFYSGTFSTIYIGDQMGIWRNYFNRYGMEVFIAIIMLLLGAGSIAVSVVFHRYYKQKLNLRYMGWGIVISAFWILFNSMLRQIMFPNLSVISDLTFLMVMMLALPFLLYMNNVQNGRYQRGYAIAGTVEAVGCTACTLLQVLNIADITKTIKYAHVGSVLVVLYIGATMLNDIRKKYIKEYIVTAIGVLGVCICSVAQIIQYFANAGNGLSGIWIAAGLIFLLLSAVVNSVKETANAEQERREAILSSEAKARFLAHMSHEIRTPINAVLGMDEMILRESKEENIREYAQDIQSAGRSLLSLINDILDFSKIESGKMEIIPIEYELSSLLNDCYNMIALRAKEKELEFRIENNPLLPKKLYGDEMRVRQIIINLLSNAVKYTKKGSVVLKVDGTWEGNEMLLKISVSDTGKGISIEDQKKLFHSFQRVDEKNNRNVEGTGLGLAITSLLVQQMDGTISVESEYGKGSVFQVKIVQKVCSEDPVGDLAGKYVRPTEVSEYYLESFCAPEASVLIVDDLPMNLKVISALLKDTQMQIDTALSGMECLKMMQKKKYDIVFLDHMMPELDGVETLRNIRHLINNKNTETPIIMLTANAISGAKEEYLAEGFADYLSKPVQAELLEQTVLKYLPKELVQKRKAAEEKTWQSVIPEKKITWLERLCFINTKDGLMYCRDDEALYKEVLKSYIKEGKNAKLTELYKQSDWKNYCIEVHGIKGSSVAIGADEIARRAKRLEFAVKEDDIAYVRAQHGKFMHEYRSLVAKLEEVLSQE